MKNKDEKLDIATIMVQNSRLPGNKQPYDPYNYGNNDHPTTYWGTTFHVLMIVSGPAVLSIPGVFAAAGFAVGLILVPFLVYLYAYTVSLMVSSEYEVCKLKQIPHLSYPDTVYHAFNEGPVFCRWFAPIGRQLSYGVFVLVWFGFCCYNYVIISANLQVLIENVINTEIPIDVFLIGLFVPLMLLAWIPKLKFLVPCSILGSIFNGVCLVLILYYILVDSSPWRVPAAIGQLSNLPILVGSVLFSLNLAGILLPLKNEMKEPWKFSSCSGVLTLSYGITSFIYTFFSLICVMKYGNFIRPSVIENVPNNLWTAQIGILMSSLALLFQYPLLLYVPFDIIWNQILKTKINSQHSLFWQSLLKTILVALSFVVSLAVPNVFLFLSLSGTVGTSIDSLIFPAVIHSIVSWRTVANKAKLFVIFFKNMIIVLLAVILIITGSRDCIAQIMECYSN